MNCIYPPPPDHLCAALAAADREAYAIRTADFSLLNVKELGIAMALQRAHNRVCAPSHFNRIYPPSHEGEELLLRYKAYNGNILITVLLEFDRNFKGT